MTVAYSGVEGAFANLAAQRIFPSARCLPYADFKAAYRAVEKGECDCVVLPIENSFNGDVGNVLDLAFFGTLHINGVYEAEVVQNFLGVKGASVSDIKKVISHPQALGQCATYIEKHDEMIAFLSQLTHCIAVSLMCANDNPGLVFYTGDSFRDLTRIANINDNMWSELFLSNREALLKEMEKYKNAFNHLYECVKNNDREEMRSMMRISTERRAEFNKRYQD